MSRRLTWPLIIVVFLVVAAIVAYRMTRLQPAHAPRNAQRFVTQGLSALRAKKPGEAIEALQKAAELSPTSPEIHYLLAQALESGGRIDEALREYQRTISLNPDLASPRYNLSVLYRVQGNYADMEQELLKAIQIYQDFSGAHFLLGSLYYERGNWTEAIGELELAVKNPSSVAADRVTAHLMIGNAAAKLGHIQEAAQHWRTVLTLDPTNREALQQLQALPAQ